MNRNRNRSRIEWSVAVIISTNMKEGMTIESLVNTESESTELSVCDSKDGLEILQSFSHLLDWQCFLSFAEL